MSIWLSGGTFHHPSHPSELVQQVWSEESPLSQVVEKYERRPQQHKMAELVAKSLEAGNHLIVEAPTGIGKTFAYLVPSIVYSLRTEKPVIITTHTIALQEQIINKDIPVLQKILPWDFRVAIAKGRRNYVCPIRLESLVQNLGDFLPTLEQVPGLDRLRDWVKWTEDGSISSLDLQPSYELWQSIYAAPEVCRGVDHDYCFYHRARRRLYSANIIVTNHALFCVDLACRIRNQEAVFPDYGAVIIDEAHTFESVAVEQLGCILSTFDLTLLLSRLFHTRQQRGLLSRFSLTLRQDMTKLQDRVFLYFQKLLQRIEERGEDTIIPYDSPLTITDEISGPIIQFANQFRQELKTMGPVGKDEKLVKMQLEEAESCVIQLEEFAWNFSRFVNREESDHVYWIEQWGRNRQYLSFHLVPVSVESILKTELFGKSFPVILTSATLAVNNNLIYLRERLGIEEAEEAIFETPFNYKKNVQLFLPNPSAPEPRDEQVFFHYVLDSIRYFIRMTDGKAFVLFTSLQMMNMAAEALTDFFNKLQIRLLVQGRDLSRSKMLEIFREDIRSVIFGCDSFWTGVDVPGESLSNVIITKLPFPVPSHPWVRAVCDQLERRGKNPFLNYMLPEAILQFRQGFGRLIRRQDDKGIIVVLDPRIVKKSYGIDFLRSIPECPQEYFVLGQDCKIDSVPLCP